jgi:hypothetical protein
MIRSACLALASLIPILAVPAASSAGGCEEGSSVSVVQHIFEMADQDASGTLSQEEYTKAGLERYGVSFEQSDTNGDGETSIDEYIELYEAHHPPAHGGGDTV